MACKDLLSREIRDALLAMAIHFASKRAYQWSRRKRDMKDPVFPDGQLMHPAHMVTGSVLPHTASSSIQASIKARSIFSYRSQVSLIFLTHLQIVTIVVFKSFSTR